jgi:hypothetical protein
MGTAITGTGHSKMVPVPVLAFLHFGSLPVWAKSITGNGIQKWCPYQYWHFCTLVQYQYGHGSLLVLSLAYPVPITGICAFWYQQQYQYWKITILKLLMQFNPKLQFISYQTICPPKPIMILLPLSLFSCLALLRLQEEAQILPDLKQLQWFESHAVLQVQVTSPLPWLPSKDSFLVAHVLKSPSSSPV